MHNSRQYEMNMLACYKDDSFYIQGEVDLQRRKLINCKTRTLPQKDAEKSTRARTDTVLMAILSA